MNKQPLTDADLKLCPLHSSRPELAHSVGIFRVDSPDGAEIVGQNGNADYSGIVFPYFLPGIEHTREYRLRRDNPDLEQRPDGEIKQKGKYLSPPGRGNLLYFVRMTNADWLKDTSLPICITEGEKKTLALWELAWHGLSDSARHPAFSP